jgi:hypothetical protein
MDAQERSEVREMIHGVLSGWEAATIAREDLINANLEGIKDHLKRLNGSVSKHEQLISDNLPHTIAKCSQTETIEKLKEALVSDEAVERERKDRESRDTIAKNLAASRKQNKWYVILTIIGFFIVIGLAVWNHKTTQDVHNGVKNLGSPVVTDSRGEMIPIPPGYKIMFVPFDSVVAEPIDSLRKHSTVKK